MKRLLTVIFAIMICLTACIAVSASERPQVGGENIFDDNRIMWFEPDTAFHNGIVNGNIINPDKGDYSTYQGIGFDRTVFEGETCVEVGLLESKLTGYFDFNYYQWNASEYSPSLDASKYQWLRIRYAYEGATNVESMKFWASKDTALNSTVGGGFRTWNIINEDGQWKDTVIYVGDMLFADETYWSDSSIRQFRIHMFENNTNPDAKCYISGFGFFETREEAENFVFNPRIEFKDDCFVLEEGAEMELEVFMLPRTLESERLIWNSANPDVATVTDGFVECLTPGSTVITVQTESGEYSDACEIYVKPLPTGDTIFDAERIMYFDEGTRFHNGIVNGYIDNPVLGRPSVYAGVGFVPDEYNGEDCVKVGLLEDKLTGYFDFNYYQWDAAQFEAALDGSKYKWLRVRYAYDSDSEVEAMTFYAQKEANKLNETIAHDTVTWNIPKGDGEWMDTVIYVGDLHFGDGTTWSENTMRQFRLYMFEENTDPDAVCYIAGFGLFETEAEARNHVFGADSYTVTYDANGGEGAPEAQIKIPGVDITLDNAIPTRAGYFFKGWSADPAATEVTYAAGGKYSADKSSLLYAVWGVIPKTGDLDNDGEITSTDVIIMTRYLANWAGYRDVFQN